MSPSSSSCRLYLISSLFSAFHLPSVLLCPLINFLCCSLFLPFSLFVSFHSSLFLPSIALLTINASAPAGPKPAAGSHGVSPQQLLMKKLIVVLEIDCTIKNLFTGQTAAESVPPPPGCSFTNRQLQHI